MNNLDNLKFKLMPLKVKPRTVAIILTTRCNGSCKMCKIYSVSPSKTINFDKMLLILDKLKSFGVNQIILLGGEPLLVKDLWRIANEIKKRGFRSGIITNGTFINSTNITKIEEYFDNVELSLDGSNKIVNDKIRFPGSFDKAIQAIDLMKKHNVCFNVRYTIQKENAGDIIKMLNFCEKNQVPILLGFVEISGYGNAQKSELQSVNLKLIEQAMNYIEKSKPKMLVNNLKSMSFFNRRINGSDNNIVCSSFFRCLHIYTDGNIYPCSVIDKKIGNIFEDKLDKVYFSPDSQRLKTQILRKTHKRCQTCVHLCELHWTFENDYSYRQHIIQTLRTFKNNIA